MLIALGASITFAAGYSVLLRERKLTIENDRMLKGLQRKQTKLKCAKSILLKRKILKLCAFFESTIHELKALNEKQRRNIIQFTEENSFKLGIKFSNLRENLW